MNESSDSDTEIDETSLTNVVVVNALNWPVAALCNNISTDTQLDASPGEAPTILPSPDHIDLYRPIRVEEALWITRIQDEGRKRSELAK